ncbi:MAG: SDR family oxidoreductase [Flavobacteriales bacterium]|nr:SDR family oxidoreductase [Flavobacteriales bacterium]
MNDQAFVKVVLVTGGSSGIGEAICKRLAAEGHRVYGTGRTVDEQPSGYRLVEMDITDADSVQRGVQEVLTETGRIDVVVNNAGLGIQGPAEDITPELALKVLDTNVMGAHRVCRAVLPGMRQRKQGLIVHITSLAANYGLPFRGFYSASKAALERYAEAQRMELAPFGVNVVTLQPGEYRTGIATSRARPTSIGTHYSEAYERVMQVLNGSLHYSRDPDEVAVKVSRLIHQAAPYGVHYAAHGVQRLSVLLKKILPSRLFEQLMMRHYR